MNLTNDILQVFMLLNSQSDNNYLVGGCVRDYLLGIEPKDFDIVTDVHMDTIEALFSHNGWKVDATGKQFLVMNVSKKFERYTYKNIKNGLGKTDSLIKMAVEYTAHHEIANFRKDGCYNDGRRPEAVEIGTLEEDAARRDLTVNAIYYDPIKHKYLDPVKGRLDLENRILKFIGRPKDRIQEDYLRVFRYYRFLTKGFKPDKLSLKACRQFFNEAYDKTTAERVRNEIEKICLYTK